MQKCVEMCWTGSVKMIFRHSNSIIFYYYYYLLFIYLFIFFSPYGFSHSVPCIAVFFRFPVQHIAELIYASGLVHQHTILVFRSIAPPLFIELPVKCITTLFCLTLPHFIFFLLLVQGITLIKVSVPVAEFILCLTIVSLGTWNF